jgi:hypothetical protein
MANNSLGSLNFISLLSSEPGGMPLTIQQQIAIVQRPGVAGTGFIQLGIKGRPFQMQSTVDVDTFANATALGVAYQSTTKDSALVLTWAAINFYTAYNNKYFIVDCDQIQVIRLSVSRGGLVGSGALAVVKAMWTLCPVYAAP